MGRPGGGRRRDLDPPGGLEPLDGVNDSKQLSPRQRDRLYQIIVDHCLAYGIGQGSVEEIDSIGILPATRLAMTRAVEALSPQPDALIIDAVRLPQVNQPQARVQFCRLDLVVGGGGFDSRQSHARSPADRSRRAISRPISSRATRDTAHKFIKPRYNRLGRATFIANHSNRSVPAHDRLL